MTIIRYTYVLCFLLLANACNEESRENPANSQQPIRFIAGISAETRATDNGLQTSFSAGDRVHLTVCETVNGSDSIQLSLRKLCSLTAGYQYIHFSVCNHNEANPVEEDLYLNNPQSLPTFYALYPDKPDDVIPDTPASFPIRISSDQLTNGYAESDYMGAMQQGMADENNTVKLSFRHLLSKIVFQLIPSARADKETLERATLILYNQPLEGTYHFGATPAFQASVTPGDSGIVTPHKSRQAIVAPQFVSNGTHLFSLFIDGTEYPYRPNENGGGIQLQAGRQQRFNISVGDGVIKVSTDINPWGEGGDTTGDAEEADKIEQKINSK